MDARNKPGRDNAQVQSCGRQLAWNLFFGFSRLHNQAFAHCALNRQRCSVAVVHFARVPSEVKLAEITGQVFLAHRMIDAHQTAFD
jgi:hypothetical protein